MKAREIYNSPEHHVMLHVDRHELAWLYGTLARRQGDIQAPGEAVLRDLDYEESAALTKVRQQLEEYAIGFTPGKLHPRQQ